MSRAEIRAYIVRLTVVTLFIGGLWLVYQAREIVTALLLALLTAILVSPIIDVMEKRKIPGTLAIFLFFLGALFLLLFGLMVIFPLFAKQLIHFERIIRDFMELLSAIITTPEIVKQWSIIRYLEQINITVDFSSIASFIKDNLPGVADQIGSFIST